MRSAALAFLVLAAGCASASQDDFDRLRAEVDRIDATHAAVPSGPSTDAELDRMLSSPLDLDTLLAAARARNPELREAAARAQAGLEEFRGAGRLDDPMLSLRTEGVPLDSPGSFRRAGFNALGLSQALPFPGNLGLRSEAALGDATAMAEMARMRDRDLIATVKRTYFEYFALTKELEVHREHVRLFEDFEKISDAKFRTGQVSQQDVLKPQVEIVMLHNNVLAIEQRIGSTKAALNALLYRPPEAPLGPPRDLAPADDRFDLRELSARALEARPETRAAAARARGAKAALDLAERESVLPDFSVGVEYMQMPGEVDAWAGMFSINLPWFTGKRAAEARKRGHLLRADELALEAARTRVLQEVRDAWLRVESAGKSLRLLGGELLPKSRQGVEVSRAGYERDKASFLDLLDAERSLRDVKLKHYMAAAQYEAAVADLERAAGIDLRRKP